jgi:protein-disulfide isomerase
MASRKQQKRQARVEREAQDEALRFKAARAKRLKLILGSVGAAALIVAVAIAISQSGGKGGDAGHITGASEVDDSLKGIRQDGPTLGVAKAGVTITEFGDLQCPACKAFADSELDALINDVVKPGKAKLVFENLNIIGPDSESASKGALAAAEQQRYWQFIELFYRNQGIENSGYVTDEFLEAVAKAAGVPDIAKWSRSRRSDAFDSELAATQSKADKLGISSTPSFRVVGPNGKVATPSEPTAVAIEDAVQQVR